MLPLILLICAVIATFVHLYIKKEHETELETFLSYLIFFNIGVMGLLAFYGQIFLADETARSIGWAPGSPFQFEMGMANLAFGVLGILSYWYRGLFWAATLLGVSILFLGAFVGHMIQYSHGDTAPNNIGLFIWMADVFLPILYLSVGALYLRQKSYL